MELKPKFDIVYLPLAIEFLENLPEKVQDKIAFNISKSRFFLDKDLFKKLNDTIWEFRTIYGKQKYRLFAFWDNDIGNLVIATHGIVKKQWNIPKNEIDKAEKLRIQYFNQKQQEQNGKPEDI